MVRMRDPYGWAAVVAVAKRVVRVPSPSSPVPLYPQQAASPLSSSTQVCESPAANAKAWVGGPPGSDRVPLGELRCGVVDGFTPNCPQ